MRRSIICGVLLVCAASVGLAGSRNVFFAGGQSNAKAEWAAAIAAGLQAGYGADLVMVHTNHPGEAMANWFTTAPAVNYSNDLFNAAGTGRLQAQIQAITNAGDQAVFRGFFWFQGESDTGSAATMDAYTNRFQAMMARLRQDLGLTNDVRFTLAVIDANTNVAFDTVLTDSGRTREGINTFRARQIDLGAAPSGSCADTRGYERTDLWHLTSSELARLSGAMSAVFTNTFGVAASAAEAVEIVSDAADGSIYVTGTFVDQDLICGTAGSPNTTPFNGIAFFRLPTNRIASANLMLTVRSTYGTWADTGAALDVWGLGFVSAPALNAAWVLMADTDSRTLLNSSAPVKLADNLVAAGQTPAAGTVLQLSAPQRTTLAAYLNGLYAQGAKPGDYVAVRVNPDAAVAAGGVSVRFGGSGATSPDQRCKLAVTLGEVAATDAAFKYYSHRQDGAVEAMSAMPDQDLISGTGGANIDFSGIAFMPLPEQPMTAASLALTAQIISGTLVGANIDVWGLGYQASPVMSASWFCTNDVDGRVLLNGRPPVKLADNIVTSGQSVVTGTLWEPTATQRAALTRYLNNLYLAGAKPGDFAVFRVNLDSTQAGAARGVRWGGSHRTNPDRRANLWGSIHASSNYLVNAGFEAGSGTVPTSWGISYNGFLGQRTNVAVRSGSYAYRMAVNGDQSGNAANNLNLAQDVSAPDFAGRVVTFSGAVRHETAEPLVTNTQQKVEFRIYWLGGTQNNTFITSTDSHNLLPTDPRDAYKPIFISGVAPKDVTGVRAQIIFRTGTVANPAITNGAAIIDDLRLTILKPVYPAGTLLKIQ